MLCRIQGNFPLENFMPTGYVIWESLLMFGSDMVNGMSIRGMIFWAVAIFSSCNAFRRENIQYSGLSVPLCIHFLRIKIIWGCRQTPCSEFLCTGI